VSFQVPSGRIPKIYHCDVAWRVNIRPSQISAAERHAAVDASFTHLLYLPCHAHAAEAITTEKDASPLDKL